MPKQITELRVFVSCPDDVQPEKDIVKEVCTELSDIVLKYKNAQLKVIDWRNDIVPLITGDDTQTVIAPQLEEYDYDIYIGILWKRLGDKRANGLTPTEGEFEDALRRKKETGKPVIQFYFKLDKYYAGTQYEAQQTFEVQKFKEKLKGLGYYCEFEGEDYFRRRIKEYLVYIVEKFPSLTSKLAPTPKEKYPVITEYLSRKVYPMKSYSETELMFLREEASLDLVSVIKNENRVVLLGDAGVGKSTEFRRVALEFSNEASTFYPFLVPLSNYVNQKISELLPLGWEQVPEDRLIIILDGLDEIESKNRNDSIRQIQSFAEQHPRAHILVSCRTNFYQSETNKTEGTLAGFNTYVLLNLNEEQVEDYVKTKI